MKFKNLALYISELFMKLNFRIILVQTVSAYTLFFDCEIRNIFILINYAFC